jgi:hypothetical protein
MLVQSPGITEDIDQNWVQKTGFKDSNFTTEERKTVARLCNILRPYVPKHQPNKDLDKDPTAHITLRAPIILIANTLFRVTGYHEFCQSICPQHSTASLHPLPLTSANIYEMFCSKNGNQFDVFDSDNKAISSVQSATNPDNKRSVFEGFFDMDKVDQICHENNIKFANR